jgi:hypothetical protein
MAHSIAAQEQAIREEEAATKAVDPLKTPGVKRFADDFAKIVELIGDGKIDAVIARLGELGLGAGNPQDRQRLEAALGGLRKVPPQKFESAELTKIKPLSSRFFVMTFIAHGRDRPFLFLVATHQYKGRWRMNHIHFSNEQRNVLAQAPELENGRPLLSYDFSNDAVARVD